MTEVPAICLRDVSFSFDDSPVIEGAELCIDELSFVSIVGPNGGGKTTLLKLMLGMLKPTSGTVRIFGKDPKDARRQIGYLPQSAQFDPHFPISVMDVVLTGRLGTSQTGFCCTCVDRSIAEKALDDVGLLETKNKSFSTLSGGQRQRVLIARALACEPRMLMLDEPTANLDRLVESRLYELLTSLSKRLTIILVSHDLGFVSRFVERVVCVNRNVHIHPTSELTSEIINEMYGRDVKLVRHDVRQPEVHHE
ncbi:MAG: ABC transporter ATP-binding protein [Pseudomonadota bacterium]